MVVYDCRALFAFFLQHQFVVPRFMLLPFLLLLLEMCMSKNVVASVHTFHPFAEKYKLNLYL